MKVDKSQNPSLYLYYYLISCHIFSSYSIVGDDDVESSNASSSTSGIVWLYFVIFQCTLNLDISLYHVSYN